jgi:hypothetical protein
MKVNCSICVDDIRKKSDAITCPVCEYVACKKCLDEFFGTIPEPRCANCNITWTREFITTSFKSFAKNYKKMREKYLLSREMAMMPETQPFVEQELLVRDLEDESLTDPDFIQLALDARAEHQRHLLKAVNPLQVSSKKCPGAGLDDDGCRGFLSEDTGKCGICSIVVCMDCSLVVTTPEMVYMYNCSKCNQEVDTVDFDEFITQKDCYTCQGILRKKKLHVCKDEDVQSAKLLKRDSKPCPKCSAMIFQIDGCDQMWCTQCQTPFSWLTGRIETGRVHNPHFFEWRRQHNEFDNEPDCIVPVKKIKSACAKGSVIFKLMLKEFHAVVSIDLPLIFKEPEAYHNRDLRMQYLLNDISKTKFSDTVQRRDKKFQKDFEIFQIREAACSGANCIFQAIINESEATKTRISDQALIEKYLSQIDALIMFVNQQFLAIGKKYSIKTKIISYQICDYYEKPLYTDNFFDQEAACIKFKVEC